MTREAVAASFAAYAVGSTAEQSPLMSVLLRAAESDVLAGGPTWAVLEPFAEDPPGSALPLRFCAALHRLVLERRAPLLATHYPSVGGTAPVAALWPAARGLVEAEPAAVTELTRLPCQTNEVGRTAGLVRALAEVEATHRGERVRLFEIGSSAGLQLWFDGFAFQDGDGRHRWGTPGSPCVVPAPARQPSGGLVVADRAGCDPDPLDPLTTEGRLRLTASVWGDQLPRLERLRGALAVAAQRGRPPVVRSGAAAWLTEALAEPFDGVTVVWHSVVQQYVPVPEWQAVERAVAAAGAVHVAYEPTREGFALTVDGVVLGYGHGHLGPLTDV